MHLIRSNLAKSNIIKFIAFFVLLTIVTNLKLFSIITNNESLGSLLSNAKEKVDLFDQYCDKRGEWESIGRHYFFKRAASFYFVDACLLRVNFLADYSIIQSQFSIALAVTINQQRFINLINEKIETSMQWMVDEYNLMHMNVYFNMTKFLIDKGIKLDPDPCYLIDNLDLKIVIYEKYLNESTNSEMPVTIKILKNAEDSKKKTALICAKCLRLSKTAQNSKLLKWWLELNQKIAYDHIELCNHSIQIDNQHLFYLYKGYLTLTTVDFDDKIQCLESQSIKFSKYFLFKNIFSSLVYRICKESMVENILTRI